LAVGLALLLAYNLLPLLKGRFEFSHVRNALTYGVPLVPHYFALQFLQSSSVVAVEQQYGLEESGFFTVANSLAVVLLMIVTKVHQAWAPVYFSDMKNKPEDATQLKMAQYTSAWTFGIGTMALWMILIIPPLIPLIAGTPYSRSIDYFGPSLFAYVFLGWYQLFSLPLFFYKETKLVPIMSGVGAITLLALNYSVLDYFAETPLYPFSSL